jgi:hypothetical protein
MVEYIELAEPLEKPRAKRELSVAQLANLEKGRARKKELQVQSTEEKMSKKMEDRFDKLLTMFEAVRLPPPEIQEALKAKKVKAAPPPPPEDESDEEEPAPAPKKIEKPKARVVAQPDTKQIFLKFC